MSEFEGKTTYVLTVGIEEIVWMDGRPSKAEELSTMEVKDSECSTFAKIKAAQVKLSGQTMEIADEQQDPEDHSAGTAEHAQ